MTIGNSTDRMGVHDLLDQAYSLLNQGATADVEEVARWNDLMEEYLEDRPAAGEEVIETVEQWQQVVHETAQEKGWWDNFWDVSEEARLQVLGTKVALIHSEISEALEELREGRVHMWGHGEGGKPEGFVVELGDAVIRILDVCGALHCDLAHAMRIKQLYNTGREHRHGGKLL